MNHLRVLCLLFLLGSTSFCQGPDTMGRTRSSDPDLSRYRLETILFDGGRPFSPEQLKNAFHVHAGDKFNHTAIDQGLDRLRHLYGDHGYINFSAVPSVQVEQDRGTVVLKISIDAGSQFNFGQLFLKGQETRAGEADALRKAWTPLSGKTYDSSLLSDWLIKNATFLPKDGQPLRHVESHLSSATHQADIVIKFPSPKS